MKKKIVSILLLVILTLFTFGCSAKTADKTDYSEIIKKLEDEKTKQDAKVIELEKNLSELDSKNKSMIIELESLNISSNSLIQTSIDVLNSMANKDMQTLSSYVHPNLGVRFTPYSNVETATDLSFTSTLLSALLLDTTVYTWGNYDGSGEPINLNFNDYFDEFIYDEDYLNPHLIGINNIIGTGNTTNNITTAYPNSSFVEFHFNGLDPQYDGIDWTSLILVFESVGGDWKLVGVVHNQWTI